MPKRLGARQYTNPLTKGEIKDWTEEDISLLKKLAFDGLTSTKIAKQLGRTRSGVCGKAARIGVKFLNNPEHFQNRTMPRKFAHVRIKVKKDQIPKALVASKPLPPPPKPKPGVPMSKNLELSEMNNDQCKFPNRGDDRPILFCGNPTDGSSCWCSYHRGIVYTKNPQPSTYKKGVVRPAYKP